jgi:hypothetical protein
MKSKDKELKVNLIPDVKPEKRFCSNCGVEVGDTSTYSALCDVIMKTKPSCSYDCNKALGQVK